MLLLTTHPDTRLGCPTPGLQVGGSGQPAVVTGYGLPVTETPDQRLRSITVERLFGERSFKINLDLDQPTVITGMNGSGKSTILRLVNAVSNADLETLVAAPVDGLRLEYSNIPPFSMRRNEDDRLGWIISWGQHEASISNRRALLDLPEWAADALRDHNFNVKATIENLLDYVPRMDVRHEEYSSVRELLSSQSDLDYKIVAPDWMAELQAAFQVIFITDQRLVVEPRRRRVPVTRGAPRPYSARRSSRRAVEAASEDIAARIAFADSDYARRSQAIDKRFPADVIAAMQSQKTTSKARVVRLQEEVERQREQLRLVGLLDSDDPYQPSLGSEQLNDDQVLPVVGEILRSTITKLEALRDLGGRLTALKDFLDARFEPKTVELSRQSGVRVRLASGESLRPEQLSSGEQQMIVLAYEILFTPRPGTLVIVDEPEISLHVRWQARLIADLDSMGAPSNLQFLLATHSPVILGEHPKLERSLDDLG